MFSEIKVSGEYQQHTAEMVLFIEMFVIFIFSLVLKISTDFFEPLIWILSSPAEEEKCNIESVHLNSSELCKTAQASSIYSNL